MFYEVHCYKKTYFFKLYKKYSTTIVSNTILTKPDIVNMLIEKDTITGNIKNKLNRKNNSNKIFKITF